jgi:hypothetical protein
MCIRTFCYPMLAGDCGALFQMKRVLFSDAPPFT